MNLKFIQPKIMVVACALCCTYPVVAASANANAMSGEAQASSGTVSVSGEVLDSNGDPLTGVSVSIEGKGMVGVTDIDGRFNVKAAPGQTLQFTYIGFAPTKEKVTGQPMKVTMKEESTALNEVVVTALGIKKEAKSLSYNVQKVDADDITRISDANIVNNLAGKVAGVTINATASGIGGASRVVMRGAKSLSNNNNALYVVDGIPMLDMKAGATQAEGIYEGAAQSGDPLSAINPEDIESISVLSGPSASALYGSAAANGVVLITTKKGEEGQTKVTISNNTTFMRPFCTPETQTTYGQSEPGSYFSWGEKLKTPSTYNPDDFFQTGYNVTNTASLTTGTAKNQTYLSIGTTNAEGIIHNNTYSRYNASVRNTSKMANDKLTMDLSFNLSRIHEKNMLSQGYYLNPLVPIYLFPAGDDIRKLQAYERFDPTRNLMTQYWPYSGSTSTEMMNPWWITEHTATPNQKTRYAVTAQFRYEIAPWINVSARAKYDRDDQTRERKYDAGTNLLYTEKSLKGYYAQNLIVGEQIYAEVLASINKYFNDNTYNLTANLGANLEDNNYVANWIGGGLMSTANHFTLSNIDVEKANQHTFRTHKNRKKRAIFGTMQLGWKSRLYLDMSARNDWSSTFQGTDTKSFFYPSIGLSGIITDLFNIQSRVLNYAKVRVSYSEVGNDPDPYITIVTYPMNSGAPATQSRRPNSNLEPERTKSWEAGINLAMFDNHFRLDATLYKSSTYNQFFERALSGTTGYNSEIFNGGQVDNKGIELTARYNNSWGDFSWGTYVTWSLNRNKIVELAPDYRDPYTGELSPLTELEKPGTGMYKMKLTQGGTIGDIYVNTLRTDEHGNIYVDPVTKQIYAEQGTYIKAGNAAPKYNLSWGNDLRFKGLNLSFLFTARVGGIGVSQTQSVLDYYGASQASADARDNGGALVNGFPLSAYDYYKVVGSAAGTGSGVGAMYVYSATNVRLSELTLGYDFPVKKWGTFIKGLNVSFIGKNLFFLYKKAPYDPEVTASSGTYMQGIDLFMVPSTRNLGFSVKVQF
ncbi:SusC/RagA family TonB-linked outer membrane protein [uncultured Muribaculum sp.]|uniref:SusC/RagA family TonB-linked outer membrane protein n=1 Tax=uncultured Muribaculum sp. TaxID=1918613 RepID=UPI0025E6E1E7|nr:SusC/RagA family TonB-linked outer membrane protein [uncultured Muribaculum sp.]